MEQSGKLKPLGAVMSIWDTWVELPFLPPSTNSLFATVMGRRVKSRGYRAFEQAMRLMPIQGRLWAPNNGCYEVQVELHGSWWFKNGKVRRKDADNGLKSLLDCVCRRAGFDDCQIFRLTVTKEESITEKTKVFIRRLD